MAASSGFDPQMFPSRIAIGYCISRNFCCDGSDMRTRCLHYKGYREFCHIVVDLVRLQSKPGTPTEKGKNSSSLQSRTFQATFCPFVPLRVFFQSCHLLQTVLTSHRRWNSGFASKSRVGVVPWSVKLRSALHTSFCPLSQMEKHQNRKNYPKQNENGWQRTRLAQI